MRISIIIPVVNESAQILKTLLPLQVMRQRGAEIILVDGGSSDNTPDIARQYVDAVVVSPRGRARQMNAGARVATGEVFWFLHADTLVPDNADVLIREKTQTGAFLWGWFQVSLSGTGLSFQLIGFMMNLRSRLSAIATGDQGIYIGKQTFITVGGYPDILLMEDIEISKRLSKIQRPFVIHHKIVTSSRRWEKNGVLRTVFLMWLLRLAYFLGVSPSKLREWYES